MPSIVVDDLFHELAARSASSQAVQLRRAHATSVSEEGRESRASGDLGGVV